MKHVGVNFLLLAAGLSYISIILTFNDVKSVTATEQDSFSLDGDADDDDDNMYRNDFDMYDDGGDDGEDDPRPPGSDGFPMTPDASMMDSSDQIVQTVPSVKYTRPSTDGLEFVELFEKDWANRWVVSKAEKFSGAWAVTTRKAPEVIIGDTGLRMMTPASFYALSARMPEFKTEGKGLTVSYEVEYENGLQCGGSYMKLFNSEGVDLSNFNNETPYIIMFGPDYCLPTNKIHLIIKSKSPITGLWSEHHLKDSPGVTNNKKSHLYGFTITPNDDFEIYFDGHAVRQGSMHEDFEPPFSPPKMIDDPEDFQPEDWVTEMKIPDAKAVKPQDWDETQPKKIPDPVEKMPEGWLVDEPATVVDTKAKQPEDWDVNEDGDWEPPTILNPKCSVGCGKWTAPQIPNPLYKGKWIAPLIDNPAYKGPWSPRQLSNPDHHINAHPHALSGSVIDGIGFDLWTVQDGIMFDNVVVTQNKEALDKFIKGTYEVRKKIQDSMSAKTPTNPFNEAQNWIDLLIFYKNLLLQAVMQRPIPSASFALVVFILSFKLASRFTRKTTVQDVKTAKKSDGKQESKNGDASTGQAETLKDTQNENSAVAPNGQARKRGGRPPPAD